MRGSAADVIEPKPGDVRLLSTSTKFVWLNRLNNSARNTADMRDLQGADSLLKAAGPAAQFIEVSRLDVTAPDDFCFPDTCAILVNNAGGM